VAAIVGVTRDQELVSVRRMPLEMGVEQIFLAHRDKAYYLYRS
jgi:hypothetical protein